MRKRRVLLIDDEPEFSELLTMRLEAHDYEVETARDGQEALEKAKSIPDLILLDVNLPKINGYEVCHRLRQYKATRYIPIIMLTAKSSPQEKVEGLYVGADDYIIKPFEAEELFARIDALFRRAQYSQELLKDEPRTINEIKRIIHDGLIVPLFQPIFYIQPRKLLGLEVLSRPQKDSYFRNSEALFDTAFRLGMHFDLEMACHKKAIEQLGERVGKHLLCFNISPYLIEDPRFEEFISFYKSYTKLEMIALELTERTAIEDFDNFYKRLRRFMEKGIKISIDDIGSGYASLNSIVELKPQFIKMDLHLIRDIHADQVRQNLLSAIIAFCKKTGITSIAEGIERQEELETLIQFEVDAAQGYLLGKPSAEI